MIKTATFYICGLSKSEKKLLRDLCRDLGRAGTAMVREWYRAADEIRGRRISKEEWSGIQQRGMQAGKQVIKELGYRPELAGEIGRVEFFARFRTEFGKIVKGEKASLPFPGRAPFIYLRMDGSHAQAQIEGAGEEWLVRDPRFWPGGKRDKRNVGRTWRLKAVDRKGWGYGILAGAEKLACLRIMPNRKRAGEWVVKVTVHLPEAASALSVFEEEVWAGIDLGLNHPAVLSVPDHPKGGYVRFFGERDYSRLWARLHEYERRKRVLNRAGKKRAALELRARITGLRKHINELVSREIVDTCLAMRVTGIRMENLKGLGNREAGKLKYWPRDHLATRVDQKAREAGLAFELVKPFGTSQTCSACGHREKGNRRGAEFFCMRCGFSCHADVNGANNIARGMQDFGPPVGAKEPLRATRLEVA